MWLKMWVAMGEGFKGSWGEGLRGGMGAWFTVRVSGRGSVGAEGWGLLSGGCCVGGQRSGLPQPDLPSRQLFFPRHTLV